MSLSSSSSSLFCKHVQSTTSLSLYFTQKRTLEEENLNRKR
jgi:hypothetical protein